MTKTNLEIEEEFAKFCMEDTYGLDTLSSSGHKAISKWWIKKIKTLLQQRMDEIEGEVDRLSGSKPSDFNGLCCMQSSPKGMWLHRYEVLNIIKSVDKK